MTVNLWIRQADVIVVASDSAWTKSLDPPEYKMKNKFKILNNVCVVTTWGKVSSKHDVLCHLDKLGITPQTHTIDDVAAIVFEYLRNTFQPHDNEENKPPSLGDSFSNHIGYHVCGFTPDSKPKCYNIFWGTDIPARSPDQQPKYESYPKPYEDQPLKVNAEFVFTGRNDLAGNVIHAFLHEIRQGLDTCYDLTTIAGKVQLADLVLRFASEITPQVGPPFHIAVIRPGNQIWSTINRRLTPINREIITL